MVVGAGGWLMDPELFFFFHNGLQSKERCPLADASSLEDKERMIYVMKMEIGWAWRRIRGDKGSSVDDKWL